MNEFVTPKQVARAIGVSESSLKRWCDKGLLVPQRTGGGHRRLAMHQVVHFLRESGFDLVCPDAIGLPGINPPSSSSVEVATCELESALRRGDEAASRAILLRLYLEKTAIWEIGDRVIAAVFEKLGEEWSCGRLDVYEERRAVEICLHGLNELKSVLAPPSASAPQAVGGSLAGDYYSIATCLIEVLLRDAGWKAQSMGTNLPIDSLEKAVRQLRPRLFWLSISHVGETNLLENCQGLFAAAEECQTTVALGGRALRELAIPKHPAVVYCPSLEGLQELASSLQPAVRPLDTVVA